MSLTRKLLLSFGVMLGLVLLLGGGGLVMTRDLNRDLERAANITARQQHLAGEVKAATSELTSLARGTALSAMLGEKNVDDYQQRFLSQGSSLRQELAELGKLAATPAESDRVQSL